MKKLTFVSMLLSAAIIAGCSQQVPEDKGDADGADSAAAPAKPVREDGFRPTALATPLPDGIKVPFRYHMRDDRVFDLANGEKERRIVMDALDGDAEFVREKLDAVFERAGFRASKPVEYRKGERVAYRHEDGRRVNVTVWSAENRKPGAPGAQAVVYYGWLVPASSGK